MLFRSEVDDGVAGLTLHLARLACLDSTRVRTHTVLLRRRRLDLERDRARVGVLNRERLLDELGERTCARNLAVSTAISSGGTRGRTLERERRRGGEGDGHAGAEGTRWWRERWPTSPTPRLTHEAPI